MKHLDCERYVEAVLFAHKTISNGIAAARANSLAKHKEALGTSIVGGERKDPTAQEAMKRLDPIPVLKCIEDGKTFLIHQPEKWLEVFSKSFQTFRNRYGDKHTDMLEKRYLEGKDTATLAEETGISRKRYGERRSVFLNIVMIYAAQYGLIKLDE